ncbi:hypothetical protein GOV11_00520 [Candidatus Woesearchaeota archaeon]|nr:hypothetical protein [Candidatus Woesearchaeota archaeon]
MVRGFILVLAALVLLVSCAPSGPTCTEPYIVNGNTCCLDKDENSICDPDETPSDEVPDDICKRFQDLCEPKFVTEIEEVIVHRYVCGNGSIMKKATQCEKRIVSNAKQFKVFTSQDEDLILEFSVRPACRGTFQAAEAHLELSERASEITFQAKSEPGGEYVDLASLDGTKAALENEYFYYGFCSKIECGLITDAQLFSSGAHILRAKIRIGETETYTRDLLVDPTPDGEYGEKVC